MILRNKVCRAILRQMDFVSRNASNFIDYRDPLKFVMWPKMRNVLSSTYIILHFILKSSKVGL